MNEIHISLVLPCCISTRALLVAVFFVSRSPAHYHYSLSLSLSLSHTHSCSLLFCTYKDKTLQLRSFFFTHLNVLYKEKSFSFLHFYCKYALYTLHIRHVMYKTLWEYMIKSFICIFFLFPFNFNYNSNR